MQNLKQANNNWYNILEKHMSTSILLTLKIQLASQFNILQ